MNLGALMITDPKIKPSKQSASSSPHFLEQLPEQLNIIPDHPAEMSFSVQAYPKPQIWLEHNGHIIENDKVSLVINCVRLYLTLILSLSSDMSMK